MDHNNLNSCMKDVHVTIYKKGQITYDIPVKDIRKKPNPS